MTKTAVIDTSVELRGVQSKVDARGRSSTGSGDITYTGPADPEESTLMGKDPLNDLMLEIKADNVKISGLTITGGAEGKDTIQITSAAKKMEFINTLFRHIKAHAVIKSNGKPDLHLLGCQFQDLTEVSKNILHVAGGGDIKVVFTTF